MTDGAVAYTFAMALSQVDGVDLKKTEEDLSLLSEVFSNGDCKKVLF